MLLRLGLKELSYGFIRLQFGREADRAPIMQMQIEEAVQKLPGGPLRTSSGFPVIPSGEATARAEAPRGELFYYLASDGSDTPARVKIRTPTFVNIPSISAMCVGQQLADLPLIQASVDPCCSCTDR